MNKEGRHKLRSYGVFLKEKKFMLDKCSRCQNSIFSEPQNRADCIFFIRNDEKKEKIIIQSLIDKTFCPFFALYKDDLPRKIATKN